MLRSGGRIALSVIERTPGLSRSVRRSIAEAAPRAVASRRPYTALLASAGFEEIGRRDATAEYLTTTRAWLNATEPLVAEVAAVDGAEAVAQKLVDWRTSITAIEAGLLVRRLYWARRA
ncbi:MAG: hypothetical protein GEU74_05880 [Nitriliruptorales bacterium]|nr:hypothetical protein [Nitriliruptorales bacterium]